ncbi:MAG: hypothetical protein J6R17_07920, partial [Bacteroidales bacterium]|nr:hypothetical protein [Bacteroidales bacterium]
NFKTYHNDIYQIDSELSKCFYELCKPNNDNLTINNSTRRSLLEAIVTYYKLHADNVRDIKSYEILRTLLDV